MFGKQIEDNKDGWYILNNTKGIMETGRKYFEFE